MGQASVPIVASRKTIERPAGLNCNFVHRQFLIERIFYNDMPVFDFSFPFHSFPVLSVVLSREQAQQMSTHLPFLACWEFPKPFYCPLTTTTAATPCLGKLPLIQYPASKARFVARFFEFRRLKYCGGTALQSCISHMKDVLPLLFRIPL